MMTYVEQEWDSGYVDAATVALHLATGEVLERPRVVAAEGHAVTPRALRDAMGCLATGVCVITTRWGRDDVAMTANSVTSVSLEPPMILVCVARTARFHDAILTGEHWGVSILDASSHAVSARFARPGRGREEQLAGVSVVRGIRTGVALLAGAMARIECTTGAAYPGGDHTILVGSVESVSTSGPNADPLIFHQGAYRRLSSR